MKKTPLYDEHLKANAKMVDFATWQMPINYGSQIAEHNAVREDAGMFDVSHMCVVDVAGNGAQDFLRTLVANDVQKLGVSRALYSCMLNENAGVIDDLIIYFIDENNYRMVINSATTTKDIAWIAEQIQGFDASFKVRDDLAIIAVQGPKAREKVFESIPGTVDFCSALKPFHFASVGELFIARTGYTGEDGFEIILPQKAAEFTWQMLINAGVKPCGLGARDTLRLEAGMSLYGNEMDEATTPYQAGLKWTVDTTDEQRNFIGKNNLTPSEVTIKGIVLEAKGVMRAGQTVLTDVGEGIITSGTFSPTMKTAIAMARLPQDAKTATVDIRGKELVARIVKLPFVRNGKILV
jgi:aminomethyltransferase